MAIYLLSTQNHIALVRIFIRALNKTIPIFNTNTKTGVITYLL